LLAIPKFYCTRLRIASPLEASLTLNVSIERDYSVYIAHDQEMIHEHAQKGGFPANRASQIRSVIDPTTAE